MKPENREKIQHALGVLDTLKCVYNETYQIRIPLHEVTWEIRAVFEDENRTESEAEECNA